MRLLCTWAVVMLLAPSGTTEKAPPAGRVEKTSARVDSAAPRETADPVPFGVINRSCRKGGCRVVCVGGKVCNASCAGGKCRQTCAGGATCNFSCAGGKCRQICAGGGNCNFSCHGGKCKRTCAAGGNCKFTCKGGKCK